MLYLFTFFRRAGGWGGGYMSGTNLVDDHKSAGHVTLVLAGDSARYFNGLVWVRSTVSLTFFLPFLTSRVKMKKDVGGWADDDVFYGDYY